MTGGNKSGRRRGRRPGESGTREAILASARQRFADLGYDGASIRDIAAGADVDPALVEHFYGSKESLFIAAMRLPPRALGILAELEAQAEEEGRAEHIVGAAFRLWDEPLVRATGFGLLRSALTHRGAAAMLREFASRAIIGRVARGLKGPDAQYRASLVASQVLGLMLVRHVLKIEPLASASVEELSQALIPTVERYLTGDLGGRPPETEN